jgi:CubicO group peptidase (beta-lactamase class C family)
MKRSAALTLLLCLITGQIVYGQARPLNELDAYVEKSMRDWEVPGLAIAVVKDDRVIYAKGFGVREAGKPQKVDERTLFAIGSATRSFPAGGAAKTARRPSVRRHETLAPARTLRRGLRE